MLFATCSLLVQILMLWVTRLELRLDLLRPTTRQSKTLAAERVGDEHLGASMSDILEIGLSKGGVSTHILCTRTVDVSIMQVSLVTCEL